jgi:tetratricopeptide (TPR) repeat protein
MNNNDPAFLTCARMRCAFFSTPIRNPLVTVLLAAFLVLTANSAMAQGSFTLYGDLKVEEDKADQERKPIAFDIVLYTLGGNVAGRQKVSNNGRYRFLNLRSTEYDLVVEVENVEVARLRVNIAGIPGSDIKQDIELAWKSNSRREPSRKQTVSTADFYERKSGNQTLFLKAQEAVDRKQYPQAVTLFRQIVDADAQDFQAWTELGTAYLLQEKPDDAEKAYRRATEVRPTFTLALLNLGRILVSQKKFEAAIEPLTRAVELQPASPDANFMLGESYLLLKKGSKAVGYLNEAAKLGRYEAHLRLAALYNGAGMKEKAVTEYEEFLVKQPAYADRKKLEQYIKANKKPQ